MPKSLVEDLGERRQAVGRARRVRDDLVLLPDRIFSSLTPSTIVMSGPLAGAVMTTFLAPAVEVLGGVVAVGEEAGRLEHDVDAEILPRQLRRIAQRQHLELVAVDRDAVALRLDSRVQVAEHRVVLQQVRERVRARQVVDRDEVDILVAERRPHDVAADPAEPVDPDPHSHPSPPVGKRSILMNAVAGGQTVRLYFKVFKPLQGTALRTVPLYQPYLRRCTSPTAC